MTAAPPAPPAESGPETATLTVTVWGTWCVALITATRYTQGSPPPRTAVWPSVWASLGTAPAALRRDPVAMATETVTVTLIVLAISSAETITAGTSEGV